MIETQAELDDFDNELVPFGPRGGGVPGVVRRVRRILDVSQRGLAQLLGVSQSTVARWETARTSPRAEVLVQLARMAGLSLVLRDEDGEEELPMRDDGILDRAGRRFPAHVDLTATSWWAPRDSTTWWKHHAVVEQSRREARPLVRFHSSPRVRELLRSVYGTPVDHPSLDQFAAEVTWHDEQREDRRRERGLPPLRRSA